MDNYPPGAANDPNAPYNQDDSNMTEWVGLECLKCSEVAALDEDGVCEKCFEPQEIEDEQEYEPE